MFPSVGEHGGQTWFANILMLYPSAAAPFWGLRREIFTWGDCCGPTAVLRDTVEAGASQSTWVHASPVGRSCRDRWRYFWAGWHCGSSSYGCTCEFHRSYRETKKKYQSADHPEASWHHLIQFLDIRENPSRTSPGNRAEQWHPPAQLTHFPLDFFPRKQRKKSLHAPNI